MENETSTNKTPTQGDDGSLSTTKLLEPSHDDITKADTTSNEDSPAPPTSKEDASESSTPLPREPQSPPEPTPTPASPPTADSTSAPQPQLHIQVPQTPQTYITFLFLSGRRRAMSFEPDTTIGRVKELVWTAWSTPSNSTSPTSAEGSPQPNNEAEERPPAPSYLRVLYLGRMLQDDDTLRDLKLPTHLPSSSATPVPAPVSTIMHLSIRPFPPPGDADSGKKAGRGFGSGRGTGGAPDPADNANTGCCGCVIC